MTRKIGKKNLVMIASIFVVALFIGTAMSPVTAKMPAIAAYAEATAEADDEECKECSIAAIIAEAFEEKNPAEPAPAEPVTAKMPAIAAYAEATAEADYEECEECSIAAMITEAFEEENPAPAVDCPLCNLDYKSNPTNGDQLFGASPLLDGSDAQSSDIIMGMILGGSASQSAGDVDGSIGGNCGDLCEQIVNGVVQLAKSAFVQFLQVTLPNVLANVLGKLADITLEDIVAVVAAAGQMLGSVISMAKLAITSYLNAFVEGDVLNNAVLLIAGGLALKAIKTLWNLASGVIIWTISLAILGRETIAAAIATGIAAAITFLSTPSNLMIIIGIFMIFCYFINQANEEDSSSSSAASSSSASSSSASSSSASSSSASSSSASSSAANSSAGVMGMGTNSAPGGMSL